MSSETHWGSDSASVGKEPERELIIDMDFARRDDCLDKMVPSDLRVLIGERDMLIEQCREFIWAEDNPKEWESLEKTMPSFFLSWSGMRQDSSRQFSRQQMIGWRAENERYR